MPVLPMVQMVGVRCRGSRIRGRSAATDAVHHRRGMIIAVQIAIYMVVVVLRLIMMIMMMVMMVRVLVTGRCVVVVVQLRCRVGTAKTPGAGYHLPAADGQGRG